MHVCSLEVALMMNCVTRVLPKRQVTHCYFHFLNFLPADVLVPT